MTKRKDYISWDEYFMAIAKMSALRSKDPNTQVGACIVSGENKILSIGYNGAPIGFSDDDFPWGRDGDFQSTKYAFVCHAELNAVLNYKGDLTGSRIYATLFPCNECAKVIAQSGIKEVVYFDNSYDGTDSVVASKKIFDETGVKYSAYKKSGRKITEIL